MLHAFQCEMMLKAVDRIKNNKPLVVDIGDSAGTHMIYLKALAGDTRPVRTISVNLDAQAVAKVKSKGLEAILCRAEDLKVDAAVDLFTSFEMVEHLHNPALFLHRLALNHPASQVLITVPYVKKSRVGLHSIRQKQKQIIYAEREHIFELNPDDWALLFLHSGWKAIESRIFYQYPRHIPLVSWVLAWFWKKTDFEGFWGVLLENDMTYANLYQDWEK
jgi:hypothetical protein